MAGRCGCGSSVCSCLLSAGDGIAITGTGSPSNPYVITATGGDEGGCTPVELTIAELVALRDAASLDVCTPYIVTDWVSGAGSLPGPNLLVARATGVDTLSDDVLIQTPVAISGPNRGKFSWDAAFMIYAENSFGTQILDGGLGTIDQYPWEASTWGYNKLELVTFTGGYAVTSAAVAAGVTFSGNRCYGVGQLILDFTGASETQIIQNNTMQGTVTIRTGSSQFTLIASEIYGAAAVGPVVIDNDSTIAPASIGIGIHNSKIVGSSIHTDAGDTAIGILTCQITKGTIECDSADIALTDCVLDNTMVTNSGSAQLAITDSALTGASSISLSGSGLLSVTNSSLANVSSLTHTSSGDCTLQYSIVENNSSVTTSEDGVVTLLRAVLSNGATVDAAAAGSITVDGSNIINNAAAFSFGGATRQLYIESSTVANGGVVNQSNTGDTGVDRLVTSFVSGDCNVNFSGTAGGGTINVTDLHLTGTSNFNVIDSGTGDDCDGNVVGGESVLNVQNGGGINASRVFGSAVLNTGAFTHNVVLLDGDFTETLTAANTNTYRGFGADTLV